jgi:hypothetical protein
MNHHDCSLTAYYDQENFISISTLARSPFLIYFSASLVYICSGEARWTNPGKSPALNLIAFSTGTNCPLSPNATVALFADREPNCKTNCARRSRFGIKVTHKKYKKASEKMFIIAPGQAHTYAEEEEDNDKTQWKIISA